LRRFAVRLPASAATNPPLLAVSYATQIGLERVLFKNSGPGKDPIQLGATASVEIPTGDLLVGGGDGSVMVMQTHPEASPSNPKLLKKMLKMCSLKVEGAVTSIVLDGIQVRIAQRPAGCVGCVTCVPGRDNSCVCGKSMCV